jgi:hypothetical protein
MFRRLARAKLDSDDRDVLDDDDGLIVWGTSWIMKEQNERGGRWCQKNWSEHRISSFFKKIFF